MLAIISPNFNQISETFVIDRVQSLAPGKTVLICMDGTGAERFGIPVLSHISPKYTHFSGMGRLRNEILPRLRRAKGFGPALSLDDRMRVIEFLRAHKVTVVLCEFGDMGTLIDDICKQLGIPLYVSFRGHDATKQINFPSLRRRYQRMFGKAAGIFAESRFLADKLVAIGCPERLLHVNPSGTDPDQFRPTSAEPGRIIGVGRLVDMKAPHLAIQAFGRIATRFPQAHLDMIGDGALRPLCEKAIADGGLEERVTLHGAQPHAVIAERMQRASIFVQHSVTDPFGQAEGFPLAISEALLSQLPVVSTLHSGIPEHVQDGISGYLVPERDIDGMGTALAKLLEDPEKAREMGKAGRAYALENLTRKRSHKMLWDVMDLQTRLA